MKRKSRRERERMKNMKEREKKERKWKRERETMCVFGWEGKKEKKKERERGRERISSSRVPFAFLWYFLSFSRFLSLSLSLCGAFFSLFLLLNIHHILVSRFLSLSLCFSSLSPSLCLCLLYKDYTFLPPAARPAPRLFSLDFLSFIFLRRFFFLSFSSPLNWRREKEGEKMICSQCFLWFLLFLSLSLSFPSWRKRERNIVIG